MASAVDAILRAWFLEGETVDMRCTFFFKQNGPGWQEDYSRGVVGGDLEQYFPDAMLLAQKRVLCSGSQSQLFVIRLSYLNVFRDVLGRYVNLPGMVGHSSDNPTTSLYVYCQNALRTKTKGIYLRGVWDEVVQAGGLFVPTPQYTAQLNQFTAELIAKQWGWMAVNNPVDAIFNTVVQNENKTVTITFATPLFPLPLPTYTEVRFSGMVGAEELNGVKVVHPLTQTSCVTKYPLAILPWVAGGKGRWSTDIFQPIVFASPGHIGERKVGKPAYLPVGRQ